MYKHGSYFRYAAASGGQQVRIQRYYCPQCQLTVSVLPVEHLPYRPLTVSRLESFLDGQAGVGSGLDPPPDPLEAGCLRRAWARFQTRVIILKEAFGLLLPSVITKAADLWKQMRRAKGSLGRILHFLAQSGKRSLFGDYRCLRLPA